LDPFDPAKQKSAFVNGSNKSIKQAFMLDDRQMHEMID
jgi:hypothetical protein